MQDCSHGWAVFPWAWGRRCTDLQGLAWHIPPWEACWNWCDDFKAKATSADHERVLPRRDRPIQEGLVRLVGALSTQPVTLVHMYSSTAARQSAASYSDATTSGQNTILKVAFSLRCTADFWTECWRQIRSPDAAGHTSESEQKPKPFAKSYTSNHTHSPSTGAPGRAPVPAKRSWLYSGREQAPGGWHGMLAPP